MLGFHKVIIDKTYSEFTKHMNTINMNYILVHCDLLQSSYLNGKQSNTIYSFPIYSPPGLRMPSVPLVQRLNRVLVDKVGEMRVSLTDGNSKKLNLINELVTINSEFRKRKFTIGKNLLLFLDKSSHIFE